MNRSNLNFVKDKLLQGFVHTFLLIAIVTIGIAGIGYFVFLKPNESSQLAKLRKEAVMDVRYPQSTELFSKEVPWHWGDSGPGDASIVVSYGSDASAEDIAIFYKEQLKGLGWKCVDVNGDTFYRYKKLICSGNNHSMDLGFWYPKTYKLYNPNIDISNIKTLYVINLLY